MFLSFEERSDGEAHDLTSYSRGGGGHGFARFCSNLLFMDLWRCHGPLPRIHVPTRSGATNLRSAATADSAVIRPVLGFSLGMF